MRVDKNGVVQRLLIQKLDESAVLPSKAKEGDLGYDLTALEDVQVTMPGVYKIRTGIACGFPKGYGALIRDRSGFSTKNDAMVIAGVIDNGYTGEIIVAIRANKPNSILCKKGDRIAQMILMKVETFDVVDAADYGIKELPKTERGSDGFGSTDVSKPVPPPLRDLREGQIDRHRWNGA